MRLEKVWTPHGEITVDKDDPNWPEYATAIYNQLKKIDDEEKKTKQQ